MEGVSRGIEKLYTPKLVPEGVGAMVRRVIGHDELFLFDPFLVLDHFTLKLPAGTPDHPHRGFETVTYLIRGTTFHEDSKGHKGRLDPGDLQWMTAGKGIVHAEMPASFDEEAEGLQLWVNLSKEFKFCEPAYQEFRADTIPVYEKDGLKIKVISGEAYGVKGPIYARSPAIYMDIHLDKNAKLQQPIPKDWNALCYVYRGEAFFGPEKTKAVETNAVQLKTNEGEVLEVYTEDNDVKFILIAGQPLNERILQKGPYVMENEEDLKQAFEDYEQQKNGFENCKTWRSQIRDLAIKK